MITADEQRASIRTGLLAAIGAYVLWGFLPLYFQFLGETSPTVILAHRIVWSVPTALVLIAVAGKWGELTGLWRQPRVLFTLLGSSIAIAANWTIYIWAVTNHRVLEGSLGYFINPLINFAFAAMLFGERFKPLQIAALGIAAAGVINQTLVVGQFPWISLSLAISFAIYGAIRKTTPVDSRVGFGMEAIWLAPIAVAYLLFFLPAGTQAFGTGDPGLIALLLLAGPVTAAPLILFAMGARRLKFSTIGVLQYIGPSLQFFLALALGEKFTPGHAVTFGLIWTGAILFTLAGRTPRAAVATPAPAPSAD
ncbi:MAG: EamA family transporter RarD [Alphaproteobacteria bacterium]|jgi:chloramphenicol-sensitive protein RarD|nr:MAG: EamA family transporter RarD [Alphaproteobacteria bacterium]